MKILDATCGAKNMWFQPNHPLVIYMDIKSGNYVHWTEKTAERRVIRINPDMIADWTKTLPFENDTFDMILFDPPHIIKTRKDVNINETRIEAQYGYLFKDSWKSCLQQGIIELFRILKPDGVFVFKWGERTVKIDEVLKLFPYKPIFGNKTNGYSTNDKNTIWLIFLKFDVNNHLVGE